MARRLFVLILGSLSVLGAHAQTPSQPHVTIMGESTDEDGIHFGMTTWEAPDGTTWTVTHNEFPSPAAAQEYLDKQVAKALKIVKRSNLKDGSGKIVGKRVEVIVNAQVKEGNRETPAVLRTNGAQFYIILSDSFRHISQFENAPGSPK
jgi:hypothetical protein